MDAPTQAITAVEPLFPHGGLDGRLGTLDARLPHRHVAQTLVDQGGDSVMLVQEHQPQVRAAIALVCTRPPGGDRQATARTVDWGHGRIEPRQSTTRAALVGDSAWPGLAPVCALGRHGRLHKTGEARVEGGYGGTSRRPARAPPARLRALVRGPWQMEHTSPGGRHVTFAEDHSQVRCGTMPHGMAA